MFDVFTDFFAGIDFSDMDFAKFFELIKDFFALVVEFIKGLGAGETEE
ncbi:MAG: hypothetical protein FWF08_06025 [Oscillospiraceae bacterium]|nr:hypothetical protein [Oscillospiraceae bacterium]